MLRKHGKSECFINNVKKQPEKTAVIYDEQSYSYGKMGEYVGSIVKALKEKGLQRGKRVALVLPRGTLQIASALATLLCGAAFVPIDINQPFNRQERIVLESESHLVMAMGEHTRMKEAFKGRVLNPEILIETPGELVANEDNCKQDLAYIIFTSGTTGIRIRSCSPASTVRLILSRITRLSPPHHLLCT